MRLLCVLLAFGGSCLAGEAPSPKPSNYDQVAERLLADLKKQDGIVYKTVDGQDQRLIFFPPKLDKPARTPLAVFIHGGAWANGDRYFVALRNESDLLRGLLDGGVACASIDYRLTFIGGPNVNDCVTDCLDAVRFLAKNAERFGIDPERVAITGSSAGGHLALMTALASSADFPGDPSLGDTRTKIRCAAAFFPLVSLVDPEILKGSNFENPRRFLPVLGGTLDEKRSFAEKLSPILLLKADSPPLFLAHGDHDVVLNVLGSEKMMAAAKEKGVPVEFVKVKGAGHGFGGEAIEPSMSEVQRQAADFILKYLLPEQKPGAL